MGRGAGVLKVGEGREVEDAGDARDRVDARGRGGGAGARDAEDKAVDVDALGAEAAGEGIVRAGSDLEGGLAVVEDGLARRLHGARAAEGRHRLGVVTDVPLGREEVGLS